VPPRRLIIEDEVNVANIVVIASDWLVLTRWKSSAERTASG
jgi:hypothetical protein